MVSLLIPKVATLLHCYLLHDNLIIILVLFYWSTENLHVKFIKQIIPLLFLCSTFDFLLFVSSCEKKYIQAHLCVFKKIRVSGYKPLQGKQKYKVTNIGVKSMILSCLLLSNLN